MAPATQPTDRAIDRRDFDAHRGHRTDVPRTNRNLLDDDVSFMGEVADGIIERDRRRMQREFTRTASFACAVLMCLCAGSITSFSLYAPRFLTDLHYTQYQVNAVSIVAELSMYLPIPLVGYLCDRYSPRPLALFSSFLFGFGYLLAAYTYKAGSPASAHRGGNGYPFGIMVLAFVGVGSGTCCMYLSAVATCAKNYATSKYRGFMLAVPIAAFGLSGVWLSQVGDHLLSDRLPDGRKGEINVFKYFVFLACTLILLGVLGSFTLQITDEEDLIEHAVEELERSGLLTDSDFFNRGYGTGNSDTLSDDEDSTVADMSESLVLKQQEEQERMAKRKSWILNHSTYAFLTDRTMWLLAAGFFLLTGPGESYINNLGTIIPTLTPRNYFDDTLPPAGSASTHVSIIALTSTFARLFTGTISDLFAPRSREDHTQHGGISFSRLVLLLPSAALLFLSFVNLAVPALTFANPPLFLLSSALLGLGYGASFSLVPIIVSVVWGAENFATNWGIVALTPAGGAALWSIAYSVNYSNGADALRRKLVGDSSSDAAGWIGSALTYSAPLEDGECRGYNCFGAWAAGSAASVAVAIVLWAFAWRTWKRRNVLV